jgi:hypothetical protein
MISPTPHFNFEMRHSLSVRLTPVEVESLLQALYSYRRNLEFDEIDDPIVEDLYESFSLLMAQFNTAKSRVKVMLSENSE